MAIGCCIWLCRDLKSRQEELAARVAGSPVAELEAKLAAAESRSRQLAGTAARKEAALQEVKGQLEATRAKLEEGQGEGGAAAAAAQELERQVKMVTRLRAEVAKKDATVQVRRGDYYDPFCLD
jgi:chromosome segregation ATPase